MKKHKIELTFATIFLITHLVMVAVHKEVETNLTYWLIAKILILTSIFLVTRVSWEKFKKEVLG